MKILAFVSILFLLITLSSCTKKFFLQEGDLLFQDLDCGGECTAIESVTKGVNGAHLSHVGLMISKNDSFMVLEAISAGVVLTPLNDFMSRSRDSLGRPKIIVGRLKKDYSFLIDRAIAQSKNYIGKPYDDVFDLSNDSYYCSEMLYLIFKKANNNQEFFSLNPMTFKMPGTNQFDPLWVEYFRKRNIPIPEGQPGINPGGMSRSPYIEIVHVYGFPEGWKRL